MAPLVTVGSDDEAIAVANDTRIRPVRRRHHAQTRSAASRSRTACDTGMAHLNDSSVNDEPHVPFGGVEGRGLGQPRRQGRSIDTFTETRWITLERGGRHYPPPFVMNPAKH